MAGYGSQGTKFPNVVKMFGGWGVIFLAILSGGRLEVLLMILCTVLLLTCWPRLKPAKVRATDNGKKQVKAKEEAHYPDAATIKQMLIMEDAMSALKNLGYNKTEAKAALDAVSGQGHTTLDALIMAALRHGRC